MNMDESVLYKFGVLSESLKGALALEEIPCTLAIFVPTLHPGHTPQRVAVLQDPCFFKHKRSLTYLGDLKISCL